ncbi:MAG: restriction endonuclease subunit S, partial [Leptolyngbya sp.]
MLDDTALLLERHFDTAFAAPEGVRQLRELILTLAMQGKLVPQDPTDPPASELLKEIEAEKRRLVKEGKIKKAKQLPEIQPEEVPYEIPIGWEWVRLADLFPDFQNGLSKRSSKEGIETIVIRLADIKNRDISLDETRSIELLEEEVEKYKLLQNDILITRVNGSVDLVGSFILIGDENNLTYCDHFIRMRFSNNKVDCDFLRKISFSKLLRKQIASKFITTAGQKTVNQGHISSLLLPLPPIPEQHRIVAKIDELMARCDELEKLRVQRDQQRITVHRAAIARLLDTTTQPATADFSEAWQFITHHFGDLYTVKANVAELRKAIL